jgi:hypothetical protein
MALPATFPVARANVPIAGLRARELKNVFLFLPWVLVRGLCQRWPANGMWRWPQSASEPQRAYGHKCIRVEGKRPSDG